MAFQADQKAVNAAVASGAAKGAVTGATIGSIGGPLGMLAGGLIGAFIGGVGGDIGERKKEKEAYTVEQAQKSAQAKTTVDTAAAMRQASVSRAPSGSTALISAMGSPYSGGSAYDSWRSRVYGG